MRAILIAAVVAIAIVTVLVLGELTSRDIG